jgi:hypothetical protein
MEFTSEQVVRASQEAVACEFGSGTALLDLRSNRYYSLNQVGAFVWELLQEPRPVSDIRDAIAARYHVDKMRCRADLEQLLKSLAAAGLVRLEHAPVP